MTNIRMPRQQRSIAKRNKIIEKGFELMCEKGYFQTNTNEIAEYAEVSTGIIYQYFNDKHEIFIEGVKNYADKIMFPMIDVLDKQKVDIKNLDNLIKKMIDKFVEVHKMSKKAHQELMSLAQIDEEVSNIFKESELKMTKKIVTILQNNNVTITNPQEKIHLIIGLVDNLCHEIVYHQHKEINYDIMESEVIKIIENILKKDY